MHIVVSRSEIRKIPHTQCILQSSGWKPLLRFMLLWKVPGINVAYRSPDRGSVFWICIGGSQSIQFIVQVLGFTSPSPPWIKCSVRGECDALESHQYQWQTVLVLKLHDTYVDQNMCCRAMGEGGMGFRGLQLWVLQEILERLVGVHIDNLLRQ